MQDYKGGKEKRREGKREKKGKMNRALLPHNFNINRVFTPIKNLTKPSP